MLNTGKALFCEIREQGFFLAAAQAAIALRLFDNLLPSMDGVESSRCAGLS